MRPPVQIRRQVVLDTLREHPWSTPSMLHAVLLEDTGGAPALLTGALYIAPWTVYADLLRHEVEGRVERRTITPRNVLWAATEHAEPPPPTERST